MGGSEFVTSSAVAEKLPCECISSKGEPPLRGRMFVDRDPKHFRRILNYLRDQDSVARSLLPGCEVHLRL